jgi:hypothetical protein
LPKISAENRRFAGQFPKAAGRELFSGDQGNKIAVAEISKEAKFLSAVYGLTD